MTDESPKPTNAAPRAHIFMLGMALATMSGWLVAPSGGYKILVSLWTFLLLCGTCIRVFTSRKWQAGRLPIVLAFVFSLASCVGQAQLVGHDTDTATADMARFNCLQARRISQTGVGFGRTWHKRPDNGWAEEWQADLPSPLAFHNLMLVKRHERDAWQLGVPMPDWPYVEVECAPDPAQAGYVHPMGGP